MKEIKEYEPSMPDLLVTEDGDLNAVARIFKSSSSSHLNAERPPSTITRIHHHKIQRSVSYINDNYHTDISRSAVAGQAGMSASHFSRMFRKVMGVSYQEYVNSKRITKAMKLLCTSSQSITEIAISLGFADTTGFGRIFKKLTGQTPSAYRNLP
jgi:AraC-like DNA-binding protein